jgi:agmatinase
MTDFGGSIKQTEEFDFAIFGIPFDEKSCYLRGAAKGPQAVREASTGRAINPWTELGVNLETDTSIVDLGDVDVSGSFSDVFWRIEKKISGILEKGAVPVIIGGDHSVSYPAVKGFAKKYQSMDILHFDAHPDLYEELHGDLYSHACPFARIMEQGLAQSLIQVGIRAATGQQRYLAGKHKVRMIEMKDIGKGLDLHFARPLYISFDMDALDPAFAPGVSHHEPGGLSMRQVINMIHALDADIVGMDVVEVNPDRDQTGITAAAAVKIIMEIIGRAVITKRFIQKESS